MTAIQICALIGLIIGAALIYWTGYRGGLIDGHVEGHEAGFEDGTNDERAANAKTIRELKASLQFIRADHTRLVDHCKRLETVMAFGMPERLALLEIAEKLRIAADTFSAFRTGKKLERDTRALREQALVMAEQLAPFVTGDAA